MKQTIVYILSLGYSGSHFLSLLMGSHSKAMHIGELYHLRGQQESDNRLGCYICKENDCCPLLRGIHPHNIDEAYDIIFSQIDSSLTTLVDASKRLYWAERFIGNTKYNMKYIHLIRDPRAIIRRWLLTQPESKRRFLARMRLARLSPGYARSLLFAKWHEVYMYKWFIENRKITCFIQKHKLDVYLITYRDLAVDTSNELKSLMDWIGLVYEPTQLEYWNFEHHGTQKAEYEWVKKEKTHYIDLRWKTFLSKEAINRVARNRLMNTYLSQLGLAFTDDGLTRVQSTEPR